MKSIICINYKLFNLTHSYKMATTTSSSITSSPSKSPPKSTLMLSFDIEATGDSPSSGSMVMLGICAIHKGVTPEQDRFKWIHSEREWCIQEYNRRDERCWNEFWLKQQAVWHHIQKHAQSAHQVAAEIHEYVSELKKTYTIEWWADPAAYDWMWLKSFYDLFRPKNAIDLGYKAECMNGNENALKLLGLTRTEISKLTTPPKEWNLQANHHALDDARYQAYGALMTAQTILKLK